MPKIIKTTACVLMIMVGTVIVSNAASIPVNITMDQNTKMVTYSGKSGTESTKIVNAVAVLGESDPDGSNVVGIDSVLTGSGGVFSGTIHLPSDASGTYKVFVDSEIGSATKRFAIIDESDATWLVGLNTQTIANFQNYMESNSTKFGFFTADYSDDCRSFAADILFGLKPSPAGYAKYADINKAFNKAVAVYEVKTDSDISSTLEYNAGILGIDYDEYENLDSTSKATLDTLLKTADYTKAEFEEIFEKNLIFAEIKSSDKWTTQRDRINKYASRMGYVFPSKYDSISNKDSVFQTVFTERSDIGGYDDIAVKLNSVIDRIYANQQNNVTSPGGSGGGAVGGGGSFVDTSSFRGGISGGQFADTSGHWAAEYIDKLVKSGGINGYGDGTFKPDNTITRAEFTKIIVSVFAIEGNGSNDYGDVAKDTWYSDYIGRASVNAIIYGSDGKFFPNNNITRQDAALIIYRVLKLKNIPMQGGNNFADQEEIADYAKDAVSNMSGIGIINGYEGKFMPRNNITRAEAATIIALAADVI